jgi:malate dehydrogenase (quinone)
MSDKNHYEVAIVGGGISGCALFYELSEYSDINKVVLIEKYEDLATLNSNANANSQTIHAGDIETNYDAQKAKNVSITANMIVKYCIKYKLQNKAIWQRSKMLLGVGKEEVELVKKRYKEFKEFMPNLEFFTKSDIKKLEPKVYYGENGKARIDKIVGMGFSKIYSTVNYHYLSCDFVKRAKKIAKTRNKINDVFFNTQVIDIKKLGGKFHITTNKQKFTANSVVVNAGAHSLLLAHKMGYGKEYGLLPISGSFYMSKQKILNGKVYTVQNPKLPFAAVHGDPDILADEFTRFGPTALALPRLERYKNGTFKDFIKSLRFDKTIAKILFNLMKDSDIRNFVLRNFGFEIPFLNKILFIKDAQKIVPSLKISDIYYAKGFGGIRGQILDKKKEQMTMGEASINTNDGIIFNMTPSPGATSSLGNAMRDCESVAKYLNKKFDIGKIKKDLQ